MNDNGQLNSDFRVDVEFFSHPKTLKLQRRLGAEAIVSLLALWSHAAKKRPDGDLSGNDVESIEILANWNGEPGKLVATLVELRWLEGDEESGFRIHQWAEHQPYCVGAWKRREDAQKGAHQAHHVNKGQSNPDSCHFCRDEMASSAGSNAGSTTTSKAESSAESNAPIPIPEPRPGETKKEKLSARAREGASEEPEKPPISPQNFAFLADKALKLLKKHGVRDLEVKDPDAYAQAFEEEVGVPVEFYRFCREYYARGSPA